MNALEARIDALDRRLLATPDPALAAELYYQAATIYADHDHIDEACFYMTQAYILSSELNLTEIIQQSRQFLDSHERI